jgi:DNA-binding response OmpR family regulator
VVVVGDPAARVATLRLGAAAFVEQPIDLADFDRALSRAHVLAETRARRVVLVGYQPDIEEVTSVVRSIDEVEIDRVDPADAAVALLGGPYDLGVVALDAGRLDAIATLRDLRAGDVLHRLPLIAYIPRDLARVQRARLDSVATTAVVSVVDSPELLADRATLFLHRPKRRCRPRCGICCIA